MHLEQDGPPQSTPVSAASRIPLIQVCDVGDGVVGRGVVGANDGAFDGRGVGICDTRKITLNCA